MNPLEFLLTKRSVALLVHINPDWDAYGSALALRAILRDRGVLCDIILEEALPFHLNFLDTDVLTYDFCAEYDYDCVCAVDLSALNRLGKRTVIFENAPSTACIDHHIAPGEPISPVSRIVPEAAATAEVVYDLMCECSIPLTKTIADYLYCALSSDTGSFRFANTSLHSLGLFGEILKTGCDVANLANFLYFRSTYEAMKLKALAIDSIELFEDGKIGICAITNEMIERAGASREDASEFSDLPRTIASVEISAVLKESRVGLIKVSLRAKDKCNVEKIAALFGGGGHVKAAGASIEGTVDEVKTLILPHLVKAVRE